MPCSANGYSLVTRLGYCQKTTTESTVGLADSLKAPNELERPAVSLGKTCAHTRELTCVDQTHGQGHSEEAS